MYVRIHLSQIVEWLLGHVTHLPSEPECHKSLMAPTGDKEVLLPLRSKCLDMIMKVPSYVLYICVYVHSPGLLCIVHLYVELAM